MALEHKKRHSARESGMRGNAPDMPVGDHLDPVEDAETDPEANDLSAIVGEHVHGPDENGHHHLNLSTLAEALRGHSGK